MLKAGQLNLLIVGQLNLPYFCFIKNGEKASRSFLLILKEKYLVKKTKVRVFPIFVRPNFLNELFKIEYSIYKGKQNN